MARTTIIFSLFFIALGVAAFLATGSQAVTALIPAFFGAPLLICGLIARKEHLRKHAMHGAAMLGLLGVLGTAKSLFQISALLAGTAERPVAVFVQLIMFLLSAVFLALCVRSFIAARKARSG
jgi:hypothetical protein